MRYLIGLLLGGVLAGAFLSLVVADNDNKITELEKELSRLGYHIIRLKRGEKLPGTFNAKKYSEWLSNNKDKQEKK